VEICDQLLDMREKSNKTQQQCADHIEVSLRMYQYYEHGEKDISARNFFRLVQYCKYYAIINIIRKFIDFFGDRDKANKGTGIVDFINVYFAGKNLNYDF
jgi:transcriptional regulator with XRE-family HTH domain